MRTDQVYRGGAVDLFGARELNLAAMTRIQITFDDATCTRTKNDIYCCRSSNSGSVSEGSSPF